jgi:hypothetical protein
MMLGTEEQKILEIIVAGIPHLAAVIGAIPPEHQARAFDAGERSYFQTMRQLGLSESGCQTWTSSLMRRLRRQVAEQDSAEQKKLKALLDVLGRAQSAADAVVHQLHSIRQLEAPEAPKSGA